MEQGEKGGVAAVHSKSPAGAGDPSTAGLCGLFPGESEMARRMRVLDWPATGLDGPQTWPQHLRIALGICLTSRFPMHMGWGPDLTLFYNDACISFLGPGRHPEMLGRPCREAWSEIWHTIGPMIDRVVTAGESNGSDDIPMYFDRLIVREEAYLTFSFSPILGSDGHVGGVLCACTETTDMRIGNRRLETLRKLRAEPPAPATIHDACAAASLALAENPLGLPFAAIYIVDEVNQRLRMEAATGPKAAAAALPGTLSLRDRAEPGWPLLKVLRDKRAIDRDDLASLNIRLTSPVGEAPLERAVLLPIRAAAHEPLAGILVAGVSPHRPLDCAYRSFLDLVAGQIATAIADARVYEAERPRAAGGTPAPPTHNDFIRDSVGTILIVDDDADMREYLCTLLSPRFDVRIASDGQQAAQAVRERLPDLVLCDVMAPDVDRFGVLRALRADPKTRDLPVILLSARAAEESRVEGFEAGADDYLTKPFSARELHARIAAHMSLARLRREDLLKFEEADRRKDEFIATLAHELRNPLAPIRHAAKIVKSSSASVAQLHWAHDVIDRQAQHMARLLDDLLDVSRISRGRLMLRHEDVELASVVGMAVETARPQIDARRHTLIIDMPPEVVTLRGDAVRLAQVISNLLNNAAKYMNAGGSILLRATAEAGWVTLQVRDHGIGIPPDMLTGIFELFFQVQSALDRAEGGLGIGLAIVKGLVELHGGSVEARSDGPGQGAEFVVRVPLREVTMASAQGPKSVSSRIVAVPPRKVLIADDNTDAAQSLAVFLGLSGHVVQIASAGDEALELAESFRPDVALLDIGMPQKNGYEVARALRGQRWGRAMTIIAITGWGQKEDRERAIQAGFDHHLTKPIDPEVLNTLFVGIDRQGGLDGTPGAKD